MKSRSDGPQMIYRSTVLKRPGWTEAALTLFAPNPDKQVPNPHYKTGPMSALYLLSRVEEIEKTREFQEWVRHAAPRKCRAKQAAPKALETKRRNMLLWIDALKIHIPNLPLEGIRKGAIHHHAWRAYERGRDAADYENASKDFLDRITVNYLRHSLTAYERLLDETWGRVGVEEAYGLIRGRVLGAIADVYPELKCECDRQAGKPEIRAGELLYQMELQRHTADSSAEA